MSETVKRVPQVGEYWMSRGTPVRISEMSRDGRYGISYVQIVEYTEKPNVTGGGGSFYWPASDFTPITEPYLLAACNVFEARRQAHDHKVLASRADADEQKWLAVMEVIRAGRTDSASPEGK